MISLAIEVKRFSQTTAVLANVDLTLLPGEFVSLLGPSGAGKTTLLRLLSGLDSDFGGTRTTPGEDRLSQGFLFQEPRLMPWLTALENVALVVNGDIARAEQALIDVALGAALNAYPRELSGGMQRRVALARAMVQEPDLLLLDEPFVSLDQPSAVQMQELLLAYWQRCKPTVVLVSHNLDEALALSDRVVFLGGRPATVIHELNVDAARPRSANDSTVAALRSELLREHPRLLSGFLASDAGA